jgi:hypothetical protein
MRSVGDPYRESTILGILVAIYATIGDQERAEQYLLEAEKSTTKSQNHAARSFLAQAKRVLSLQKGNISEARASLQEVEIIARQTQLLEFLCMNLLLPAKLEPDPRALLNEALEIAVTRGFKLQEYFAAQALGEVSRAEECLNFLREHAPEGWF